jgi:ribosomal protein S18 acetylase RimI-like enzyme
MAENHTQIPIRFGSAKPEDRPKVTELWDICGLTRPWNDADADFDFALAGSASTVLVGMIDEDIVASAMVGHDGHRGCVYYVSVHPSCRDKGVGALVMREAEQWLQALGVPKMNLIVRSGNDKVVGFYESIGYQVEPNTQMTKRLDGD